MRRRFGLVVLCGLVLPLVVTASASAQGAVLELSPQSGPPGTVINVTGAGFNGSSATTTPGVQLRLSTRDAAPLRTAVVSPQNTISDSFPIPAGLAAGEYLVLGTQTSTRGASLFGTPARARLRVTAGRAAAASAPATSTGRHTVLLGGLIVGVVLLAGGAVAVARQRTANRPLGN